VKDPRRPILFAVLLFAAILIQCRFVQRLGTTNVVSINDNPRKYVGKTVTVQGEVTARMNLLAVKYFKLQDASGEIYIVTDRALPVEGTKVKVSGKVEELSIGPWQKLVIRERTAGQPKRQ
jgi:membrane protein implicated in regulation of membrane protease activity